MKTIIKKVVEENELPTSYLRRVGDTKALALVRSGDWLYTSKSVWKVEVRDVSQKADTKTPKKKKNKTKNKKGTSSE